MPRTLLAACVLLGALGCAMGDDGVYRRQGDGGRTARADAALPLYDAAVPPDDAGSACIEREEMPCTTSCGTQGTATCTSGRFGVCVPPAEECDGIDQDCDLAIDEELEERTCATSCGGGVSRCVAGAWSVCMGGAPRTETCDGTDEDCDGAIDNGLTRACSSACGAGVETCVAGRWQGCTAPPPRAETCDGTDEDCDGRVDGMTRRCTSACGAGMQMCNAGGWGMCSAPQPVPEACNLRDDDCDGNVDNGFQVRVIDSIPFYDLTAEQPTCSGPSARLDVCNTAAKRWCHAYPGGCFTGGGAGPLQATTATARVVCFGNRATERNVTFAAVSAASGIAINESNIATRVASSATHRYCRSQGFAAGVGPTEHSTTEMTVTCLPSEMGGPVDVPTSELIGRGCNPVLDPNTLACSSAVDNFCRARGDLAGYGPVEWNTSSSAVVCLRSL
ncbi:MAG: hypothetical protein IT378_19155 [Sandaracinaceae bacterium]|nr:hypothetical protein [Sandaracinaceae bacterium]